MLPPPQPAIATPDNHLVTSATTIGFSIDFGEQVLASDPRRLFNLTGASRTDVVLDSATGVLSLLAYVENAGADADIRCGGTAAWRHEHICGIRIGGAC